MDGYCARGLGVSRQRTLLTRHLYFGVDAQRLRDGSGRVLSRVVGLAPERARVSAQHVKQDFGLDTVEAKVLVDEFVAEGLLRPRADRRGDYFLTERFVEVASARVVEPLPRTRAKAIVSRAGETAARINAEARRNPLAIDAVAAFGTYMSLDDELAELDLAVLVRPRDPVRRFRWRPLATKAEGASEIRHAFRALSSFVHVVVVTDLRVVPRPFAFVWQDR
jgi:hypothetical protein